MSSATYVMQMVRAHYGRDERAFASAAGALARGARDAHVRAEMLSLVQRGVRNHGTVVHDARLPEQRQQGGGTPRQTQEPTSTTLYKLTPVSFPELLLDDLLQLSLDELIIELEYRTQLADRGLRARNRLLFSGPPGNGKTASASALATALGSSAYCVSIPDLVGSYVGQTNKALAELFGCIRDGMVVVFDELDAIGSSRSDAGDSAGKEKNAIVTALLTLLDRHKSGVIVATTNRPDIIDAALRRRFDEHLVFPAPSPEQLRSLAGRLEEQFQLQERVFVDDCANFDECTKRVTTEARRQVMAELLSAANENEEGEEDGAQKEVH